MKKLVIIFAIIIVILLGILIFVPAKAPEGPAGSNATSTGVVSTSTGPLVSSDGHVAVTAPQAGATISSPVTVKGTVTGGGGWFFEGVFPVAVFDADGTLLGSGQAIAPQGEWTSTGTVPFTAKVVFSAPHSATGTIELANDNPSGLPQNAKSLDFPVSFAKTKTVASSSGVMVSGQVRLGPTCPVETNPPTPGCEPRPYATTVFVFQGANPPDFSVDTPVVSAQTDAAGNFSVSLALGNYWLQARGGSPFPRCGPIEVEVPVSGLGGVVLNCDTGIR
ncbi:MAG: hypothetical protein KGJ13_05920 [Patescibacteria group bacterium]|nr:hypothetical protein [Patescibacteria group bacterium]